MPNVMNRQQLIDRLELNQDPEVMHHELEEMLENELNKPAEEIDSQLVAEILQVLEEKTPTQEEYESTWTKIQKPKKKRNWRSIALRSVASVASLVLLFFIMLRTAEAFNWTFLLKWMQPVAETFGLYNANEYHYDDPDVLGEAYTDDETEYEQVVYESLDDMPAQIDNTCVVPPWMPDDCAFVQGIIYQDPDMSDVTTVYMRGEEYISIIVSVFHTDILDFAYNFEMTAIESGYEKVSNQQVTYYRNAVGDVTAYSWIANNKHYALNGSVSEDELIQIIEGFLS